MRRKQFEQPDLSSHGLVHSPRRPTQPHQRRRRTQIERQHLLLPRTGDRLQEMAFRRVFRARAGFEKQDSRSRIRPLMHISSGRYHLSWLRSARSSASSIAFNAY